MPSGDAAAREEAMIPVIGERARVRRLDPRVVAKIAAGEMIQRPVSAVKELLENSLDAGSTEIEISIGDAADQWLQVSDDGWGMGLEDLTLALESHATSKLALEEDLLRVATLGFRGEALPSIGRVARLTIVTWDGLGDSGHRVVVEGGDQRVCEPAARARGTTVRVEDLFFNSPVRKRFLKGPESEVRLIVKLVATYALAFPAVGFRLLHRGEPLLQLPATDALPSRVAQIHGASFLEKCLPIESASPLAQIQGFVGVPELARPGTQHQTFLVNQRWVAAPWFSAAVRQGFGDLIAPNRHPFALVFLTCEPSRVDVNVHPTKREVRFFDESALFGELSRAVREQTSRLIPEWNLDPSDRGSGRIWSGAPFGSAADGAGPPRSALPAQGVLEALYGRPRATETAGAVREGGGEAHRDAVGEASGGGARSGGVLEVDAGAARRDALSDLDGAQAQRSAIAGDPAASDLRPDAAAATASDEGAPADSASGQDSLTAALVPLWQLHQRYLFAQTRQGMLIIDQHAAHERILYERALQNLRGTPAPIQQLLFPLVLSLESDEWEAWREIAEDSINLGIDADEFGPQTVLLRGAPMFWDQDPEGRFRELLRELSTRRTRGLERLERLAAAFACRSAVRSGQVLTLEEMNALVDQLFATGQPHGDPHGRPTFIQVSLADLDRRFGRSR